ncbi:amino acid permease [Kovacikia minuta]|uniref:amino acid permease n=1 Tax=Kovacikia minuta TaxID=2931930 RepID=UPI0020C7E995|nr:amino acid permease [Kovacikia minuta]
MSNNKRGIVQYEDVGDDYLDKRQLRRSAGWVLLWALGVGAVISGDFSGWNLGLAAGGFGGLAIGTFLMAAMYVCMVYSIAELSAALPHAGGFYSFTRSAFGPFGGFICGVTDTIEYVVTPAVVVFFIGSYMNTLLPSCAPVCLVGAVLRHFCVCQYQGSGADLEGRVGRHGDRGICPDHLFPVCYFLR